MVVQANARYNMGLIRLDIVSCRACLYWAVIVLLGDFVLSAYSDFCHLGNTLNDFNLKLYDGNEIRQIANRQNGYDFNAYGTKDCKEKRYAALGSVVKDVFLQSLPVACVEDNLKTLIYCTKTASNKLLILIADKNVPPGFWSQRGAIYDSMQKGTAYQYVREALDNGFSVLMVTTDSAQSAWDAYVESGKSKFEKVVIVKHGLKAQLPENLVKNHLFDALVKQIVFIAVARLPRSPQPVVNKNGSNVSTHHVLFVSLDRLETETFSTGTESYYLAPWYAREEILRRLGMEKIAPAPPPGEISSFERDAREKRSVTPNRYSSQSPTAPSPPAYTKQYYPTDSKNLLQSAPPSYTRW